MASHHAPARPDRQASVEGARLYAGFVAGCVHRAELAGAGIGRNVELRKRVAEACLSGSVFFRGNDRSPAEGMTEVVKAAAGILAEVTPEIFDRFGEAAVRTADAKKGTESLLVAENLRGLPAVFGSLGLVREEKGNTVFVTEHGPLGEVLGRIRQQADYGHTATGKYLESEFEKEPFGWDFEVVRLFALSLLRAGMVEVTSRDVSFDTATSPEAVDAFSNNSSFRQASFRPRKPVDFAQVLMAAEAFKESFGSEIKELDAILSHSERHGAILLYDEGHVLADDRARERYPLSGMLAALAAVQRERQRVRIVLCGLPTLSHNLKRARTYAERMFRHAVVDNLELDAAADALAIPLATTGRSFGLSLIGHIVEETAGYPYFLQFFGAFACSRVGLEHIELADFQRIESALTHELDLAFFEDRFLTASSAEQGLLLRMATRSDDRLTAADLRAAMRDIPNINELLRRLVTVTERCSQLVAGSTVAVIRSD